MAIVMGLFGSDLDATEAMDKLLGENIESLETRVLNGGRDTSEGPDVVIPVGPAGGGAFGSPGTTSAPLGGAMAAYGDWLHDVDEVERSFYYMGMKDGAVLAIAKMKDEDASHVQELMRSFGARVYSKD